MATDRRSIINDPNVIEAARRNPGGWAYEIDWDYPENQRTPPEAIRGGWEVGPDGKLTGLFTPNSRYRPIEHCDRILKPYVHAVAKSSRGQWITEIDPRGEDRFPDIPETLIRGWWYVDVEGNITDRFRPNSRWIDDGEGVEATGW